MNSLHLNIGADLLTKIETKHIAGSDGATFAIVYLDEAPICGKDPAKFREIAARCSEAAAILEAANVPAPVEPVQAESGVA